MSKGRESQKHTWFSPNKSAMGWSPNFNSHSKSPLMIGNSGAFRAMGYNSKSPFASMQKSYAQKHNDEKVSPAKKLELTPEPDSQ